MENILINNHILILITVVNRYLKGSSWMSNNPSVGLLVQGMSQSRLKMAKISYFSIEIQLSLNCILSEIFEILGVNKQMFICCDPDEPYRSPK